MSVLPLEPECSELYWVVLIELGLYSVFIILVEYHFADFFRVSIFQRPNKLGRFWLSNILISRYTHGARAGGVKKGGFAPLTPYA